MFSRIKTIFDRSIQKVCDDKEKIKKEEIQDRNVAETL